MIVGTQLRADLERKRFARLQALAALAGYAVDAVDADAGGTEYCITRWAMTKRCGTLDSLAAQLARMGVDGVPD